ncbi:MAG: glucose-6-phosphate isomerase [Thiovulaceae bacterium]|nr:glucose-6-phosphate isomerase [Sulfurimonadaceae bacterium]
MTNSFDFTPNVNEELSDAIAAERESIGFYDLCDQDITPFLELASKVEQNNIVIIGIGGSALGASAVYRFLDLVKSFEKKLHILDTTDPLILERKLHSFDMRDAYYAVISKSGATIETIAVAKYIDAEVTLQADNCVIITDAGSALEKFAKTRQIAHHAIPDNVGGRFSVLSSAGLIPLALVGVDIRLLLEGAAEVRDAFFNQQDFYDSLMKKATYYAQNANTYNINCLFSYSEVFREFNAWYVQLWGESLGKKQRHSELHVGLTPVGLIGPTDQHSFLQLIVDGKRDKSVTVIKIKAFENRMRIPDTSFEHLESMDIINGYNFSDLLNMQADSMIEALGSLDNIPLDVIEIESVNASEMGQLILYYELLTALAANMLDINAYDQPGVEMGKTILKEKLRGK